MLACLLAVAGGCATTSPQTTGSAADPPEGGVYQVVAGRSPAMTVTNGNGRFVVEVEGRGARVVQDGTPLPESRIRREGDLITVCDADGEPLLDVGVFRAGGPAPWNLVYSPGLDPASAYARIGAMLGTADQARNAMFEMAVNAAGSPVERRLREDPENVPVVLHLREAGPAMSAGLRAHDVVVRADGVAIHRPADLETIVALRPEHSPLVLTVMRRGEPAELTIEVPPPGARPDLPALEASYRRALGGR